jgi:hypothetical protein
MIFFVVILIKLVVSNGFLYSYFLNRILRDLCLHYYENKNDNSDSDKYKNRTLILFFEFVFNFEIYKTQLVSVFDFYELIRTLSILSYIYLKFYYNNHRNSNRKLK